MENSKLPVGSAPTRQMMILFRTSTKFFLFVGLVERPVRVRSL